MIGDIRGRDPFHIMEPEIAAIRVVFSIQRKGEKSSAHHIDELSRQAKAKTFLDDRVGIGFGCSDRWTRRFAFHGKSQARFGVRARASAAPSHTAIMHKITEIAILAAADSARPFS